uniref:Reverse transcriptase domain-containing protein n=1 Tax=Tanacetum cinerariifolium TaxID=118510 RepID=A0A6L2KHB6_TANCI|nr:reverse transcriptase domain-containing protein [Tanacetum cinerariifolium]
MRTRSSSNLIIEPVTILKRRNRRHSKQIVKPEFRTIVETLVTTMADTRTRSELLQAPTEGCVDAIVISAILADNFELKVGLLQLVTSSQFHGFERDDPHAHIRWFNKITSTLKYQNVSNEAIKLMLFPFSLDGAARIWLEKEPPRSILTWDDLACDRFKDLLRKCPHHGFSELHQIDTFYNALTQYDQGSQNAAPSGNLLNRTPRNALTIIENKSKVRISRNKPIFSKVSTTTSSPSPSSNVTALTEIVKELVLMNKATQQAIVKAIEETCMTCGGPHPYYEYLATGGNTFDACAAVGTYSHGEATKDKVQTMSSESTAYVQPLVLQVPISEPKVVSKPNPKPLIPYPSRLNNQKLQEKTNNQRLKFLQIFQRLHIDLSFADALLHMLKFASTFKSLLSNKERLFKLASTPLNENCLAVLLKKLPKKLRDPGKFLIPCDFSELEECLALANLGASINLMPLSVPLVLRRPFLRTTRALIDVHGEELTLKVNDEAITFKFGHTSRYSRNYYDELVNQIDVIDIVCKEYAQEVLGFLDSSMSGNPTLSNPIIATSSPSFTSFKGSDFILEEIETFLRTPDELSNLDDDYYDTEGDILYLEKLLNEDPSSNLPLMKNEELKQVDVTMTKPLIEEPSKLKLKDLPSHLECAFLEGTNKLPVLISKELKDEEKAALLKVLKSHKRAIAWKISNIKGIYSRFCTKNILVKDDFKPLVQHQRRANPKIHEVIKKEVIKLLDAGLIYPIFDSPWETPFIFSKECIQAFKSLKKKLTEASILVAPDWDLPFEIMCDASDFAVEKELLAVVYAFEKFQPYLVLSKTIVYTDHSTLKYLLANQDAKPRLLRWVLLLQEFNVIICDKKGPENLAADHLPRLENPHQDDLKNKEINETFPLETLGMISSRSNSSTPIVCRHYQVIRRCVHGQEVVDILTACHNGPTRDIMVRTTPLRKSLMPVSFSRRFIVMPMACESAPHARFGTPRAIISDHSTHFCNDQFAKVMLKYGVTHRLFITYHLQTIGQVKVSNCGLKHILEKTVGENQASWFDKLDNALWAFRTAFKTPIGCTPYKLVYGKACHLSIELEHKAY